MNDEPVTELFAAPDLEGQIGFFDRHHEGFGRDNIRLLHGLYGDRLGRRIAAKGPTPGQSNHQQGHRQARKN